MKDIRRSEKGEKCSAKGRATSCKARREFPKDVKFAYILSLDF